MNSYMSDKLNQYNKYNTRANELLSLLTSVASHYESGNTAKLQTIMNIVGGAQEDVILVDINKEVTEITGIINNIKAVTFDDIVSKITELIKGMDTKGIAENAKIVKELTALKEKMVALKNQAVAAEDNMKKQKGKFNNITTPGSKKNQG
jgi:hypothetical protein